MIKMKSIKMKTLSLSVVLALLLIQVMNFDEANCAPNGMNGINNNNNFNRETAQSGTNKNTPNKPINFLRGLFRRQTSSSSTSSTSSDGGKQNAGAANNIESESDDVQNQTEMDAQKFMDSLPNVVSRNSALIIDVNRPLFESILLTRSYQ